MTPPDCILCESPGAYLFHSGDLYDYFKCPQCDLIFANPEDRLSADEEKMRYDFHQNDPMDDQYRQFLSRLFIPLEKRLKPGSHGLDIGSGPGPALHLMFEEKGHIMDIYDPFYAPEKSVFENQYDFVTTTETAEHFYHPKSEFEKIWSVLKPGGMLGIMTQLTEPKIAFESWHYIRDDTHVCFYSRKTFRWLASRLGASVEFINGRTIILQKINS